MVGMIQRNVIIVEGNGVAQAILATKEEVKGIQAKFTHLKARPADPDEIEEFVHQCLTKQKISSVRQDFGLAPPWGHNDLRLV